MNLIIINIKNSLKTTVREERKKEIRNKNRQGKLLRLKWGDEELDQQDCFACLTSWKDAPTHTIAGMMELYEQLIPTKLYTTVGDRDKTLPRIANHLPESKTLPRIQFPELGVLLIPLVLRPARAFIASGTLLLELKIHICCCISKD